MRQSIAELEAAFFESIEEDRSQREALARGTVVRAHRRQAEKIHKRGRASGKLDELVIATKVFSPMSDRPNMSGLSRKHIVQGCDASLRRLGIDTIDLYYIHRFDASTPIDETLTGTALHDFLQAGIGNDTVYGLDGGDWLWDSGGRRGVISSARRWA